MPERSIFLSTLPAGQGERRLALSVALISSVLFVAAAPFAKLPLGEVRAFIPIYESALVVTDLITAVLLFGQFRFLRSRALLVLAGGYLFTALMTIAHALTFPSLFSPTGLLGSGPQSTAWIYMFWHGGFPLFVIAYALLTDKERPAPQPQGSARVLVLCGAAAVAVAVCALTLVATQGQDLLPVLMKDNRYSPDKIAVVTAVASSVCGLSLLALIAMWRRRPHTVLDLWLTVVMCVWLFDVALSAVLVGGRFDLGFYGGRIYGLLAASFVLIVLLLESNRLYARLVVAHHSEHQERLRVQEQSIELKAARESADFANRAKSTFLATISHELRTPLNAIIGFSEALKDGLVGDMSDMQNEYIGEICSSGEHLLSLINDILDLSKIEAGLMTLELEPVDLNNLLASSLSIVGGKAARQRIRLEFAPGEDLGLLQLDIRKTKQIVYNLLSNAVKFSVNGGRVALSARFVLRSAVGTVPGTWPVHSFLLVENEHTEFVEICVSDGGIGISEENMAKLFKAFSQIDSSLARKFEGTGLGLAMVKQLAELHGGTVAVTSAVGEGTRFAVWLPLRAAGRIILPRSDGAEAMGSDIPRERVALVVEDDALVR